MLTMEKIDENLFFGPNMPGAPIVISLSSRSRSADVGGVSDRGNDIISRRG